MTSTLKKDLDELIEYLYSTLNDIIKHDDEKTTRIKNELKEFRVLPGKTTQTISSDIEDLKKIKDEDRSFLYLFTNAVYLASGNLNLNPDLYFNEREIKEIKTNYEGYENDKIDFPFTFNNVIKGSDDNYLVYSDGKTIVEFWNNKLLQYNFETQREARVRTNKTTGQIIEVPKIIEASVKAIEDLIIKNKFDVSTLTLNARLGSSDVGEELYYDEENKTLTINKGTLLDVLDGFHRINGIVRALRKNPSINPLLIFNIVNYDKKRARDKFVQINTTNRVSHSHKNKMSESRQADFIARRIQDNTDLSDKITSADSIYHESNLLLTFKTLSDAIDDVFNIVEKPEAIKESNYLIEFFNELIMIDYDAFVTDIVETRKKSLINANVTFYGYTLLAKRMKDENIKLNKLSQILSKIDFSRDNKDWKKYKVVNDDLTISNSAKKGMYKFFETIDIK